MPEKRLSAFIAEKKQEASARLEMFKIQTIQKVANEHGQPGPLDIFAAQQRQAQMVQQTQQNQPQQQMPGQQSTPQGMPQVGAQ